MKNFLFPAGNATFGLDLAAIDIQRERDHGTPPYNEVRCQLKILFLNVI